MHCVNTLTTCMTNSGYCYFVRIDAMQACFSIATDTCTWTLNINLQNNPTRHLSLIYIAWFYHKCTKRNFLKWWNDVSHLRIKCHHIVSKAGNGNHVHFCCTSFGSGMRLIFGILTLIMPCSPLNSLVNEAFDVSCTLTLKKSLNIMFWWENFGHFKMLRCDFDVV